MIEFNINTRTFSANPWEKNKKWNKKYASDKDKQLRSETDRLFETEASHKGSDIHYIRNHSKLVDDLTGGKITLDEFDKATSTLDKEHQEAKKSKDKDLEPQYKALRSQFNRERQNLKDDYSSRFKKHIKKSTLIGTGTGAIGGAGIGAATTIGMKNRLMKKGLSEEEAKKKVNKARIVRSSIGALAGAGIGAGIGNYGAKRIW